MLALTFLARAAFSAAESGGGTGGLGSAAGVETGVTAASFAEGPPCVALEVFGVVGCAGSGIAPEGRAGATVFCCAADERCSTNQAAPARTTAKTATSPIHQPREEVFCDAAASAAWATFSRS